MVGVWVASVVKSYYFCGLPFADCEFGSYLDNPAVRLHNTSAKNIGGAEGLRNRNKPINIGDNDHAGTEKKRA
ncbi:MAG: hypothetical protein ACOC29_01955 [Candidatus Sumerlaeota bacterium]